MFDFVVVGAGSAGCVLANRLSADGRKVALIEAGPPAHRSFKVRVPGMYTALMRSALDWSFATEPQEHADGAGSTGRAARCWAARAAPTR
jgi:choline dehydrogenase